MLKRLKTEDNNETSISSTEQEATCNVDEKTGADSFSLEFATSQWQKLVSNAECLFMTLVRQGIAKDAKEQIDQWLFLKQECEEFLIHDGSIIKEKEIYSLDRIDEVTESEGSVVKSETETEYSDSGAEIDDINDSSQVEMKREDFAEKLEILLNKFRSKTDILVSQCLGPIDTIELPVRHTLLPSTPNVYLAKNQRRKSILPSNPNNSEKLPSILDGTKKEFDLQTSLTQSKKKLKNILKQLRKDEEQAGSKTEDGKRSKEKVRKFESDGFKNTSKEVKRPTQKVCQNDVQVKELLHKESKRNRRNSHSLINSQTESSDCSSSDKLLRDEITNLRITREFLLEQRKGLDVKFNKEKSYSRSEERRFIELDEAIEALDTTIEYKNGTICGRKNFEDHGREEGEQMLVDRLMKLSEPEMRFLLFKYFQKTVDLRESGKKMEQQIAELDHQIEAQAWKIQALSSALQQANAENERRLVMVHREHEEKLHLMFRHYTGTGTSSSADTKIDEPKALLSPSQNAIPQQNLRKLQGTSSPHTTKVTRQKNKLIIQQQTRKSKDY